GELYQILPVAEAKTRAIVPPSAAARQGARATDSFVIEIFPVRHVSSDEMVNILQPFVTPGGDALSYPRSNLVVVTDLQTNVTRLRELVTTFDTDVFHNLHARVFKMQYGDPDELANEILGLLAPYGVTPTGEGEGGVFSRRLGAGGAGAAVWAARPSRAWGACRERAEEGLEAVLAALAGGSAGAASGGPPAAWARGLRAGCLERPAARAASRSPAGWPARPAPPGSLRARHPSSSRRYASLRTTSRTRSSSRRPSATTS